MLPGSNPCWEAAVARGRWAHTVEILKAGAEPGKQLHTGQQGRSLAPSVIHMFYPCLLKFQKGAGHCSLDKTPQTVSHLSSGLQGAELEMGSAPGKAFITHGGEGQAGQLLYILPAEGAGSLDPVTHLECTLAGGTNAGGGHGEAFAADTALCCSHAVDRPCVHCRSPGIYSAAGRTPLPAEQINCKAL